MESCNRPQINVIDARPSRYIAANFVIEGKGKTSHDLISCVAAKIEELIFIDLH